MRASFVMSLCSCVIHQDQDDRFARRNVIRACLNGTDAKWDVIRFDGLHTKGYMPRGRLDGAKIGGVPERRHTVGLNIEPDNWCALSLYDIK